jgi:hypothetical protein
LQSDTKLQYHNVKTALEILQSDAKLQISQC